MGNSKSKKMKINQNEGQNVEEDQGRINSLKTDISDTPPKIEEENVTEQNKDKDNDNASSASTVEVLDDK